MASSFWARVRKRLIAKLVAETVIELLEMVEIDEQQHDASRLGQRADACAQFVKKTAACERGCHEVGFGDPVALGFDAHGILKLL